MSNQPLSLFLYSLKGLHDFKALDTDDREIVFYSEDNASRVFFEPIIKELLRTYEKKICYLTSSANDPVLTTRPEDKIRGFYIGSGLVRAYLFFNLKANIMVMTMPDLETYQIKRSRARPVHYVYVFHALMSTSMVYRYGAFDHFDALLCVGPHHIKEIRTNEKLYNLKPKTLIESGYGRLDSIIEEAQHRPRTVGEGKKKVLVAPTWGDHALLETCAIELVDILLESGYQVVYRPHPMTVRHRHRLLAELNRRFEDKRDFSYETEMGSQESLHASDIMISDWSGAAIEYAFGLERPVIFIDLPRKVNNPEYQKILLEPFEVTIRSKIGSVISTDCLEDISGHIEELCSNPESFTQEIRKIRSESIYNIGTSGAAGAAYIAQTAEKLRGSCRERR